MRSKGEAAVLAAMSLVFLDSLELLFSLAAPSSNAAVVDLRNFTNTDLALIESFWSIAFGNYSLVFWVVLVLIGLILPFSLDLVYAHMRRPRRALGIVSSVGVLVGGYALRHCVVVAGVHPVLIATGVM